VFGFQVYPQFESDQCLADGIVETPSWFQRSWLGGLKSLGGHAVMAVGYDDAKQMVEVRNSWGAKVQDEGYFWLPFDYITNSSLASDFWTIRAVS
jgi:C1A family cysteine protease